MKTFKNLFKSDYEIAIETAADMAKKRTPENVFFKAGKEVGFEDGFKQAMQKRIKDTIGLSKKEEADLLEFLINNDIELIYDDSINGMRARKTKFGWKDNGVSYIHKFI